MTTLDQLKPGQRGIIRAIADSDLTPKLLEMGLLPGKEVIHKLRAPLGDPIAVRVSGYQLSLRLERSPPGGAGMSRVSTSVSSVATDTRHVALVGNPNAGKSSLFNLLTGLNQKVGNYPAVTVDKKTGRCVLTATLRAEVIDLPGTYSVFPRSGDERVVLDTLMGDSFDAVVAVVDMVNLERGLLLATQLIDLHLPVVLVLNMADLALQQGIEVDTVGLSEQLGRSAGDRDERPAGRRTHRPESLAESFD